MDANNNHLIDYTEFMMVVMDRQKLLTLENLKLSFHNLQDKDGFITAHSLKECWLRQGVEMSDKEIEQIMGQVEHVDKKKINFDEFVKAMQAMIED